MPTILITGGHKGLGYESIKRIAAKGQFDLVLGGRNLAEVEAVVNELRIDYDVNVQALHLDISSLASVRAAAIEFKRRVSDKEIATLQVLMLNAGAQFLGPVGFSADGYERTFATNYLGNFLLVHLLLDEIRERGRIVFTASGTHDPDTRDGKMVGKAVAPDALALARQGKQNTAISGGKLYSTSKLCTILHAYELDRRLKASNAQIASIAFDPGLIVETGLSRSAPPFIQRLLRVGVMKSVLKAIGVTMGSLPFSGGALADVAISPQFEGLSGKYMQSNDGRLSEARSSKASYDTALATKLWKDSETLAGLQENERPTLLSGRRTEVIQ